jgi:hypothetical protein
MADEAMSATRAAAEAPPEGVVYDARHRVLICTACAAAVAPGAGVLRHWKDHHADWRLERRRAIAAYAARVRLADPDAVEAPQRPESEAVAGLAVHEGWRCAHCGYLAASAASMREHCRGSHPGVCAQDRA